MTIDASDIRGVTKDVTKEWTRQRKAEERGSRTAWSRDELFSDRVNFTDVADAILPQAYQHASGGGKFTVSKRQLYYACREDFKAWTGRELTYGYFSTLIVQYMNRHPETASWKVTADPRGTLMIPNANFEVRIPCGTIAIQDHLLLTGEPIGPRHFENEIAKQFPSLKHGVRFQAVLYIEKEGFEPLLEEAQIAEHFDLATLSCKGQSVVAARRFVDEVCSVGSGVPLLVVHDFDKSGFEISQRLTSVSDWAEANDRVAYRFKNEVNVVDLGLRLTDVENYKLASETVEFTGHFAADSICTAGEQEFLRSGRRVELNTFTSPQFIKWLEAKLTEQGLDQRLVPSQEVLEDAYRRALEVAEIKHAIKLAAKDARKKAQEAEIPPSLRQQLIKVMNKRPDEAWDPALYRIAQAEIRRKR